jgi:hypothetical protein
MIKMRQFIPLNFAIVLLTMLNACNDNTGQCKTIQEWKVQDYRIVKSECPDMALASYFTYDVYVGNEKKDRVSQLESCVFTWQADNENFLILNTCDSTIKTCKPNKILLDTKSIDSVTIFSNEVKQSKLLTQKQIEIFANDWNNSKTRSYSDKPFDSAFFVFPAYQYKVTIFSKGNQRPFYGYNYLILDSTNWKFEMSKTAELKYFHNYWNR